MAKQANTKLIGGFVLGAIILIVVIFLFFGSGKYFQKTEHYVIFFRSSVSGLKVGAPVKLRGIEIGEVSNIRGLTDAQGNFLAEINVETDPEAFEYYYSEGENWLLTASQEEALKFYVEKGLRAQLATQSLVTGQLYVKIDYFPGSPVNLVGWNKDFKGREIPTIPSSGEELQQTLDEALKTFNQMPLLEITTSLASSLKNIDSLVKSPEINRTLVSLTETLQETKAVLAQLENQIEPVSTNLVSTSKEASEAMEHTTELMTSLENAIANDRYNLQVALKEFTDANRAMRNLLDYLQRDPGSLIHGKK